MKPRLRSARPARRFQPIKDRPVRSRVSEAIREAIFSGALRPGDPLRELHLARELEVSQATVREALVQLENSGLVVRIPNKETLVTKLSNREVRERVVIRESLEVLAWLDAAKRIGEDHYAELEDRVEAISVAVDRNNYFDLAAADLEFHKYIWECSENLTLYRTLEQITAPLFAFVSLMHSINRDPLKDSVNSHEAVIAALKDGRARVIRDTLRQHTAGSYDAFLSSGVDDLHGWCASAEAAAG